MNGDVLMKSQCLYNDNEIAQMLEIIYASIVQFDMCSRAYTCLYNVCYECIFWSYLNDPRIEQWKAIKGTSVIRHYGFSWIIWC